MFDIFDNDLENLISRLDNKIANRKMNDVCTTSEKTFKIGAKKIKHDRLSILHCMKHFCTFLFN